MTKSLFKNPIPIVHKSLLCTNLSHPLTTELAANLSWYLSQINLYVKLLQSPIKPNCLPSLFNAVLNNFYCREPHWLRSGSSDQSVRYRSARYIVLY